MWSEVKWDKTRGTEYWRELDPYLLKANLGVLEVFTEHVK